MKILGYENGNPVLYMENKDKALYRVRSNIPISDRNKFEKVDNFNLRRQIMEDDKIVDFTETYNMGMEKLYEMMNSLDNIEDPIIQNKKEDLQRIYQFMMGRGEIAFPLIARESTGSEVVSNKIVYELTRGVNPFAILITKKNKDEMKQTDKYPEEAITIRVGLMATSLGLEGYTAKYEPLVELSEDEKTISYGVKFANYLRLMQEKEQAMLREIEAERTKERKNTPFFQKVKSFLQRIK